METKLHEGEEIIKKFSPARTSVLLIDYLTSIAILVVASLISAGLITFLENIPLIGSLAGSSIVLGIGIVLALPSIIRAEILVRGNTYYITTSRVIHEYKFIRYDSKIIKFDRITHINSSRSLVDRIFKTGKLLIKTAGTNKAEMEIKKIKKHSEIEREISDRLQKHVSRIGTGGDRIATDNSTDQEQENQDLKSEDHSQR